MDWKTFLKKNKLEEGQLVKVTGEKQEQTGNIIPSSGKDKEILRLKLSSGYNIGIKISEKLKVEKLEGSKKVSKGKKTETKQKPDLPKIAILHTGGTIASRVDYRSGAVYSSFNPNDLLAMFPELMDIANFSSKLISNMWSDDLRFTHFEAIGKAVKKAYEDGAEGIILGMGTDNMAVASAAMAFVLEKCPIPVIFVGAQRSSDRGSSDAAMNLICAATFITKTDFAGVAICMHENTSDEKCVILPACKTRKLHSSRRDAFRTVNDIPIALVDYKSKKIEFLKKDYERKNKDKMIIKPKFEDKTGLLKIHINMFPEQFEFFTKGKYKGLVIEGTGLGHTPGHNPDGTLKIHEKFFPAIKKLIDSGCVVVMTTTTLFGRVHMHVYDKGTDLVALGVIPGQDMLPETAFVKLAWLLGNYKQKEVQGLIAKNLRGEISASIPYEEKFAEGIIPSAQ
ncbi:MAG: Glu-tRNA(Gln) amidotransferase subunit GatD [archaeon]|nr:Glu-tRNA(Gln) amidotransferase subunit GatD [archaeon]